MFVSFPVSHCISQDMTRYFYYLTHVALFTIYLIYWKIKGSENAIKGGRGDRGLPEPMEFSHCLRPRRHAIFISPSGWGCFCISQLPLAHMTTLILHSAFSSSNWPSSLNFSIQVTHFLPPITSHAPEPIRSP